MALCAMVFNPELYCETWIPEEWSSTSKKYLTHLRKIPLAHRHNSLLQYDPINNSGHTHLPSCNHQAALHVAQALKDCLNLDIDTSGRYLFTGANWMDPGEVVVVWEHVKSLSPNPL